MARIRGIKPGDLIGGKYRIDRVIGKGGMGVVLAARHAELHQRVAIKVLPDELIDDAELVERFMREARAAARLRSEHAVRVIDTGRRENGVPFIVMELLEGQDLGDVVARGPVRIDLAVDWILEACEAIGEAHALGFVHRDLKPRNMFLAKQLDGTTVVKVLDFGLAKNIDVEDRALTSTTAILGSPQYMSPEQMRATRDVDFRTDIWSLGVCLYELLAANVPFDAEAVPVLCAKVLTEPPRPISMFRDDLPPGLVAILDRCLQKAPAARFSTVSELARALEPYGSTRSYGSAQRLETVLAAAAATIETTAEATIPKLDTRLDTHHAATFDSSPERKGARRNAILGGLAAAIAAAGIVLMIVALSHPSQRVQVLPGAVSLDESRVLVTDAPTMRDLGAGAVITPDAGRAHRPTSPPKPSASNTNPSAKF